MRYESADGSECDFIKLCHALDESLNEEYRGKKDAEGKTNLWRCGRNDICTSERFFSR